MTEELVIMRDRQAVTTSLQVARDFEKNHKDVLKAWKNLAAQNCATKNMFVEGTYVYPPKAEDWIEELNASFNSPMQAYEWLAPRLEKYANENS